MTALQGGGRAATRGGLLSFNALPLPPVPLCDETLQVMGPDAEPTVPQPCALCPAGCRSDADLNRHIDEVHGGKDRYRRRWIYEVMHRRPDGVHSGDIGALDADGLPDADKHPAVRRLYEAELAKYGVIWRSEEARAQAAQIASAQCVRWRADAFSVDERLRVSSRDHPLRGTEYLGDEVRSVDELRIGLGVWFFGMDDEGVGDPVPATIVDLATGGLPLMKRREDGQAEFVKTPTLAPSATPAAASTADAPCTVQSDAGAAASPPASLPPPILPPAPVAGRAASPDADASAPQPPPPLPPVSVEGDAAAPAANAGGGMDAASDAAAGGAGRDAR
eukprot:gene988-20774_t